MRNIIGCSVFIAFLPLFTPGSARGAAYDMWAVVNRDGTLARGTAGTTASVLSSGMVRLVFPKRTAGCAVVGNLGYPGPKEDFVRQTVITARAMPGNVVLVKSTYPGDFVYPTGFTSSPALDAQPFHVRVDCRQSMYAKVSAAGKLKRGTAGTTVQFVAATGEYAIQFPRPTAACALVATVQAKTAATPQDTQAYPRFSSANQVLVKVQDSRLISKQADFDLVATCGSEAPYAQFTSGYGVHPFQLVNGGTCALTSSVVDYSYAPSYVSPFTPSGYVSTWYQPPGFQPIGSAIVLTKNAGYGVQGLNTAVVATCN